MNPAAADFAKTMTSIHKEAEKALNEAAGRMKVQYDKGKRTCQESPNRETAYGSIRPT